MKHVIFILPAIALLFAACDKSTLEGDEEYARLNDVYHLEKIEFYLGENDGLSVTEREGMRETNHNETPQEWIVSFKAEDTFSSTFHFEYDQPFTLVIDEARKIRIPGLVENNVLYMGQDETWSFRDGEPEGRFTGDFREYSWNIPPMCRTTVDHTVRTSTITASFNAYFVGENTHSEVVMQGKWEGRETEYLNYEFVTEEIK